MSASWNEPGSFALHLRAAGVGILAGGVAVLFHLGLDHATELRLMLGARLPASWVGGLVMASAVAACVLFAVWLVRVIAPEASGSGISHVEEVLEKGHPIRWVRVSVVKFLGGIVGIGAGLALGREGPTVQMGASMGQGMARVGDLHAEKHREVIALGAAAGLTGAFNAPLAGMLFFFEELRQPFRPMLCSAALLAVVLSDTICRLVGDQRPELGEWPLFAPPLQELPLFALLGVVGGLAGVLFNRTLLAVMRLARVLRRHHAGWLVPVVLAVLLGWVAWMQPAWVGGGQKLLPPIIRGSLVWQSALILLSVRFLLTVGSYATDAAGGIFAPLLLLGSLLGVLFAAAVQAAVGPAVTAPTTAFAIAGMAGLFTGVVRAPLTGVLLMVEMAGAYNLLLPLLVACLLAKWTADLLRDTPIYEALQKL